MKSIRDCFGRAVRLTDERMAHTLQHQEMAGMEAEVERTLQSPRYASLVRTARSSCSRSSILGRVRVGNGCASWYSILLMMPSL